MGGGSTLGPVFVTHGDSFPCALWPLPELPLLPLSPAGPMLWPGTQAVPPCPMCPLLPTAFPFPAAPVSLLARGPLSFPGCLLRETGRVS